MRKLLDTTPICNNAGAQFMSQIKKEQMYMVTKIAYKIERKIRKNY